jgi:crotonobetaine/carnitine-CoA ligase
VVAEDEIKINFTELVQHMAAELPHYMVPRYFEMIEALPKTPSMRVQKFILRARGNGPDTWDLAASGFKVTQAGLVVV